MSVPRPSSEDHNRLHQSTQITASVGPASNPFATRFVAPGQIPWICCGGTTVEELASLFSSRFQNRAAIIGPHGTGKSTLLEHLAAQLGQTLVRFFPDGRVEQQEHGRLIRLQLRKPSIGDARIQEPESLIWQTVPLWDQDRILMVDGFEQLSWLSRRRLIRQTQRKGVGLLVTAHRSIGLPVLYQSEVTVDCAEQIIAFLMEYPSSPVTNQQDLAQRLYANQGNMREVLMELFDVYHQSRAKPRELRSFGDHQPEEKPSVCPGKCGRSLAPNPSGPRN